MKDTIIRRAIHPEVRVLDATTGTVSYVASDETVDRYGEVIRAKGWRFDHFQKNAPFVDSHHYGSVEALVGRVLDFVVKRGQLVETVQWAIDVAENKLAQLGWRMTQAGYLKAVSVGFYPVKAVTRWDPDQKDYTKEVESLGLEEGVTPPNVIYKEQQQVELSACIIGANPNALARSYKAGVLNDSELEMICSEQMRQLAAVSTADIPAEVVEAQRRAQRAAFWRRVEKAMKGK